MANFEQVVELYRFDDGVAQITLHEVADKNMFSDKLCNGLRAALKTVGQSLDYKVVVLTGFSQYFCCGGTKDNLMAILDNKTKFTDNDIHYVAQQCALPVIAAMQGRAIGGGWSLGLFCDFAIFSANSSYQAPYMQYGFTPGAGSTLIFPYVLGKQLANEILLCAGEHKGQTLKDKGLALPVVPRQDVLPLALLAAHLLAKQSRQQLIEAKKARMAPIHQAIDAAHRRELAMHEKTFVGQTQVLERIDQHFAVATETKSVQSDTNPQASQMTNNQLNQTIKSLLATEVMLDVEEIDDSDQFTNLGIDSIIAVSWIDKINAKFNLNLDSFEVYNYPSVSQFCQMLSTKLSHRVNTTSHTSPPPLVDQITPIIEMQLRIILATELFMEPNEVLPDLQFKDMGLDSIHVVTLVRKINSQFNCNLSTNDIYNYPNLTKLTEFLATEVETITTSVKTNIPAANPRSTVEQNITIKPPQTSSTIAVIGMAGQFPDASNVTEYWQNIAAGRDSIKQITPERWSIAEHFSIDKQAQDKSYSKWMGILDSIAEFDPLFFNISPHEAEYMDPQQRLFLQTAWHCIEDAGYDPNSLAGSRCGVFVGCEKSDYGIQATQHGLNAYALLGSSIALLPARISYFLDLQGPCMASDTACSASLVAITNACDSLVLGNSDLAIAGGVYVLCGPQYHIMMSKAGMLSPTGRCHTFDQQADGFVPGEGVGALLLKRLSDAQTARDNIHGVIKAWGTNQDGKTNGITAPSGKSQQRLIEDIYGRFDIDINDIQLVEAHGTGTKLGDPIEVDALCSSFKQLAKQPIKPQHTALGSVKSNIGHLATAAGVAATIKVLQALKHQQLPPTIQFEQLNSQIKLDQSPFYINTECQNWTTSTAEQLRHGAVSSFGFSGTNAHLVLAEPPTVQPSIPAITSVVYPFVLSANSQTQLANYVASFSDFVQQHRHKQDFTLNDLSYTLCTGRSGMKARIAFSFSTKEQLIERLSQLSDDLNSPASHYHINNKLNKDIDNKVYDNLDTLLATWVKGANINWQQQRCFAQGVRRISLPVYPFAKQQHWLKPITKLALHSEHYELTTTDIDWQQINWQAQALDHDRLTERFKFKAQRPIIIIYEQHHQQQQLLELLNSICLSVDIDLEQFSQQISYYHHSEIDPSHWHQSGQTILVLSQVPVTLLSQIQQAPAIKQTRIYWLNDNFDSCQQLANSQLQQLYLLQLEQLNSQANELQLLVQEWLNHDVNNNKDLTLVRYQDGQRWQYQHSQQTASKVVTTVPSKALRCVNKKWSTAPLAAALIDQSTKPLLMIVNQTNHHHIAQTFAGQNVTILLANSIECQLNHWQSAELSATAIIAKYGQRLTIVDCSDCDPQSLTNQYNTKAKIAFYQHLVAAASQLQLLYVSYQLQSFDNDNIILAGAQFAGLANILAVENNHVQSRHIDIDADLYHDSQRLALTIQQELGDGLSKQGPICYRHVNRYQQTLSTQAIVQTPPLYSADGQGVYVISGGLGGIGMQLAHYLVERGAKKLILMGLTPLPDRSIWQQSLPSQVAEKITQIEQLESQVEYLGLYTGPLTNQAGLNDYFAMVRQYIGPITGVIHAAGKVSDFSTPAFIAKQQQQIDSVLEPKITGLDNLCQTFIDDKLEFFVAFSSLTALLPQFSKGCFDYAMANGYVEHLMAYKHQHHSTAYKAITWVDWHQSGMATRTSPELLANVQASLAEAGLYTHSNEQGKLLFELALNQQQPWVLNCYMNPSLFAKQCQQFAKPETLSTTPPLPSKEAVAKPIDIDSQINLWEAQLAKTGYINPADIERVISFEQLQQLNHQTIERVYKLLYPQSLASQTTVEAPEKLKHHSNGNLDLSIDKAQLNQTQLIETIRHSVTNILKLADINIDDETEFQDYGLDSISATQLAVKLQQSLDIEVKSHWLIDFPTIKSLSTKVQQSLTNGNGSVKHH